MSIRWSVLLAVPWLASCAALLGLDDAAGELDGSGGSGRSTTSPTSGPFSATTMGETGPGGGGGGSTQAAGGGSGAGGGVEVGPVRWIEGPAVITALQPAIDGAVLIAFGGIAVAPSSFGGCALEGARRGAAMEIVRATPNGACEEVLRREVAPLDGAAAIFVRGIAANLAGDYVGWGGEAEGVLAVGDRTFPATTARPIAEFAARGGLIVAIDAPGSGAAVAAGLGELGAFVGQRVEGSLAVQLLDGRGSICAEPLAGTAASPTIDAFEVPSGADCAPLASAAEGFVLDVASDGVRATVAYRETFDGADRVSLYGYEAGAVNAERNPTVLFYVADGSDVQARVAIDDRHALLAATFETQLLCGDDVVPGGDPRRTVGLRLDLESNPPACRTTWSHPDVLEAIPWARDDGEDLFLVRRTDDVGWHVIGVDEVDAIRGRRFCDACEIVDAIVVEQFAWAAGVASSGAVLDAPRPADAPAAAAFVAGVPTGDLLLGSEPW